MLSGNLTRAIRTPPQLETVICFGDEIKSKRSFFNDYGFDPVVLKCEYMAHRLFELLQVLHATAMTNGT